MQEYDLFVIGAGSGGVRCARIAAQHGAHVGIAERRHWGGACVNLGCVPKKLMVYASEMGQMLQDAPFYGWNIEASSHDWARFMAAKNAEIARLNGIYMSLLEKSGIDLFTGEARLLAPGEIEIVPNDFSLDQNPHQKSASKTRIRAKKIILAPGSRPKKLEIEGAEFALTSDDIFYLKERPQKIAIIGGGYIGVEFAGIFAGLGSETHLIYRQEEPLRGFDGEIRRFLKGQLPFYHIHDHSGKSPVKIEKNGKNLSLFLDDGTFIEVDAILMATGRVPALANLSLENCQIKIEKGHICVDAHFETSCKSIYAIGDILDRHNLTPTAIAEGHLLAEQLFAPQGRSWNFECVPKAVFFSSPLASVGLSEEEALEKYQELAIYTTSFRAMKQTLPKSEKKIFMKLVIDKKTDIVLGAHMMGGDAPEIMQILALAVSESLTKKALDRVIALHPTSAEEFVTMRTPTRFVS